MKRKERIAITQKKRIKARNKRIAAATVAGTITALILMNGKAGACSTEYLVKPNDTLYSLSKKYDITVDQLMEANSLTSEKILVGQQLLVPDLVKPIMYSVQRGDTLYSLSKMYGSTVKELKEINFLQSNQINIGQTILIPQVAFNQEVGEMYTVLPGDTLWGIANRYGIDPQELAKENDLHMEMVIIGQQLFIPGTASVSEVEIVGAADSFTVEFNDEGKLLVLKVPYGTASAYQEMSGQYVRVIHKNGAVISAS